MMIILIRSGAQSLNPALIAKMNTMNLRWLQYEWRTNPYMCIAHQECGRLFKQELPRSELLVLHIKC